jgi:cytoskeletal protein RodZ
MVLNLPPDECIDNTQDLVTKEKKKRKETTKRSSNKRSKAKGKAKSKIT